MDLELQAVKMAIDMEKEGSRQYRRAAAVTDDAKARAVFERLADEEGLHAAMLAHGVEHAEISAGRFEFPVLDLPPDFFKNDPSPIFTEDIKDLVMGTNAKYNELDTFILAEKKAINHYVRHAERSANPDFQQFFRFLAAWEQRHLNALISQRSFWGPT
jgi:Mn-containing catalase